MRMEAAQAISEWTGNPPRPLTVAHAPQPAAAPLEERFETEAMPHLNDIFRTAHAADRRARPAEDVIQEVYLQAWRSFDRFESGTNCRAWLYKILFHCVSHHRRKWFRFPLLKEKEEFLEANLVQPESVAGARHRWRDPESAGRNRQSNSGRWCCWWMWKSSRTRRWPRFSAIPIGTVMSRLSRGRGAAAQAAGRSGAVVRNRKERPKGRHL